MPSGIDQIHSTMSRPRCTCRNIIAMPSARQSCSGTTMTTISNVLATASEKFRSLAMREKFAVLQPPSAWNASAMVCPNGTRNSTVRKISDGAISR